MGELSTAEMYLFAGIIVVLLIQGMWIFNDAGKRGQNKWLWGIFGLLNTPSNLVVYLIVTRVLLKSKTCPYCHKNIKKESVYCHYCGEQVEN